MSKEHLDPRLRLSVSSPRPAASSSSSIQNPAPNSASSTSASPSPSLPSRPLPSSRSSSFSSHSAPSAPSQALFASGILAPTPRTSLWLPRLSPAPAQTPLPPASALQSPFQQQQQLPPPPSPAEYHGSLASTSSSPYTPGAVHQHDQHQHQQIGQVRPLQPFPLPTTPSSSPGPPTDFSSYFEAADQAEQKHYHSRQHNLSLLRSIHTNFLSTHTHQLEQERLIASALRTDKYRILPTRNRSNVRREGATSSSGEAGRVGQALQREVKRVEKGGS
ncbi:hypothetical protein BDY24DRAFT_377601 [Mrakia frigida]|uniref:uncharacterized protein n=1 Tax=Mrakia frigida TaxID=29902 RepID=UPI003FCC0DBC